jgi:methylmalonyl-CoA/ethylmalonyl-CoA epimerase
MKIEKIDRVVLAVDDVNKAADFFASLLGIQFDEPVVAEELNIRVRYSSLGLQLNEAITPESDVAKFLKKRGGGCYCVVFRADDVDEAVKEFTAKGVRHVGRVRVGKLREEVFHPADTYGLMIVVCQYPEKHPATIAALEFEPKKEG